MENENNREKYITYHEVEQLFTLAKAGDIDVQFSLGHRYYYGPDYGDDVSVDQSYLPAIHLMGVLYEDGEYVEADMKKALSFFREAAKKGHAPSQRTLGAIYSGEREWVSIEIDDKALNWFRLAADQENKSSI